MWMGWLCLHCRCGDNIVKILKVNNIFGITFLYLRYLERRRDKQESLLDETEEPGSVMEANNKFRSMIDITYTMKNSDTFSE